MEIISYDVFLKYNYEYAGEIAGHTNHYIFKCVENKNFDIGAFFCDDNENSGYWFINADVGVLASKCHKSQGWVLDNNKNLLNIDASSDIFEDKFSDLRTEYFINNELTQLIEKVIPDFKEKKEDYLKRKQTTIEYEIEINNLLEEDFRLILQNEFGITSIDTDFYDWIYRL